VVLLVPAAGADEWIGLRANRGAIRNIGLHPADILKHWLALACSHPSPDCVCLYMAD